MRDVARDFSKRLKIGPEDLSGVLSFHARDCFLDIVGDWLRNIEINARNLAQLLAQMLDQFLAAVMEALPCLLGVQVDEEFAVVEEIGICSVLRASEL